MVAATSPASAAERPPLPIVERHSLTDGELFAVLDPDHAAMAEVLAVRGRAGDAAGKAALAAHFRQRREPIWGVDPHQRTSRTHTIPDRDLAYAKSALQHVFDQRTPHHSFGPDIDWLDNPTYDSRYEFDKEWSMGFLRMPWWDSLGRAYWATGDETYAQELVTQFLDFRRKHPIPTRDFGGLGSHPLKYKVPEWRTLEISIRLRGSWTESFFRLLTSPSLDDHALLEMLKAFHEMADFLHRFTRTEGRTNNWTTSQVLSLHTAGAIFPEFRQASTWRRDAVAWMWAEFEKQVYPDGVQWELAPGYGVGVTKQFRGLVSTAALAGDRLPDAYMERLEGMYSYFLQSSVAGQCPAFGDSGHGSIASLMAMATADFPGRADFLWAASGGTRGTPPEALTDAWPWAGQYAMRSGWAADDRFMIIDAGPYGVSHQHEDNLSYELYAYGDWLVPDPGSYRYNYDSPWRRFMTSSLSHNTMIVDHQSQNRAVQRDLWVATAQAEHQYERAGRMVRFQGAYDAGYGPEAALKVRHIRSVFFVDGLFWVILDRAIPADAAEHLYETLMVLNAKEAQASGNRVETRRQDGPNLLVVAAPQAGQVVAVVQGQTEPVRRGWIKGGRDVLPHPQVAVAMRCSGKACFALLLCPVAAGLALPDGAGIEYVHVEGGLDARAVRVTLPGLGPLILADQLGEAPMRVAGRQSSARGVLWEE